MPPRSSNKSRKSVPKRSARKLRSRRVKNAAKKNLDTKFVQCVVEGSITPKQGVFVSNYLYGFVPLLDADPNYGVMSTDKFKVHQTLYDRVRINSMRIILTPKANTFDASQAQNDANLTLSGNGMIYSVIDRDGPGPWLTSGTAGDMPKLYEQYPSCVTKSLLKKLVRTYGTKWPKNMWLDTDPNQIVALEEVATRLGLFGGVTWYAENLVEDAGEVFNEPWGHMRIEYNCVFQGTKPTNTKVTDGVITITPIETSLEDAKANFSYFGSYYPQPEEEVPA